MGNGPGGGRVVDEGQSVLVEQRFGGAGGSRDADTLGQVGKENLERGGPWSGGAVAPSGLVLNTQATGEADLVHREPIGEGGDHKGWTVSLESGRLSHAWRSRAGEVQGLEPRPEGPGGAHRGSGPARGGAMRESRVWPFLVAATLFAHRSSAGPHILQYTLTVGSQDGSVQPRFLAEGHLDGQPFLRYDSENGRAEPQGPWAEAVLGAETRDAESELLTDKGQDLRMSLAEVMSLQEHRGGLHSLQETWGCEIRGDGSTRGFWDFRYDGEPLLSYDLKTQRWTVPQPSAQALAASLQRSWEDGAAEARKHYRHMQADCVRGLRRYLHSWMGFQRPVSPAVTVTRSETLGGTVNLTCWAFGFYPRNVSLAWHQDGQPLSQDAQWSGGVLPYENGTYQVSVVTQIPQGEEPRFTCHMGHSRTHSTHPVPGKAVELQCGRSHAAIGAAAAVIAVAVALHFCWCRREHGAQGTHSCPGEHSELMSV